MVDFEKRQQFQIIFRADIRVFQFILLSWCSIIHKNVYSGVAEGADYESFVRLANCQNGESNMVDKIFFKFQFFGIK